MWIKKEIVIVVEISVILGETIEIGD